MSCSFCVHFYKNNYNDDSGMCCLYPKHISVAKNHYCGQITMRLANYRSSKSISMAEEMAYQRDEFNTLYGAERKKRIALEKKLKALRQSNKNKTD